mmetsp:Transcript_31673/g.73174  ORF Transcript_31673/g.73174 Transcript_31673/m.73174 type:complete len:213 (-) Transcript_31673:693-1331(-)
MPQTELTSSLRCPWMMAAGGFVAKTRGRTPPGSEVLLPLASATWRTAGLARHQADSAHISSRIGQNCTKPLRSQHCAPMPATPHRALGRAANHPPAHIRRSGASATRPAFVHPPQHQHLAHSQTGPADYATAVHPAYACGSQCPHLVPERGACIYTRKGRSTSRHSRCRLSRRLAPSCFQIAPDGRWRGEACFLSPGKPPRLLATSSKTHHG